MPNLKDKLKPQAETDFSTIRLSVPLNSLIRIKSSISRIASTIHAYEASDDLQIEYVLASVNASLRELKQLMREIC